MLSSMQLALVVTFIFAPLWDGAPRVPTGLRDELVASHRPFGNTYETPRNRRAGKVSGFWYPCSTRVRISFCELMGGKLGILTL